jgi:DNA processing protein
MAPSKQAVISDAEMLARLRLIRSENVGPVTFRHLLNRYQTAQAALQALPELAARGGMQRRIRICSAATANAEIAANQAVGARLIFQGMAAYPQHLAAIEDAPAAFSLIGHCHLLTQPSVAIVGARNASANALRLAAALAREIGAQGYVITSGLARGIDAAAHQGALKTGTVAVLGGGVDVIYPRENADLYQQIAAAGALISETRVGSKPQARHFPARNRIIAGLSQALLVVEAAERSGSLITARLAGEQGREVCAIPGSPLDPRCRGTNRLIREGAHLVENADDVINILHGLFQTQLETPIGPEYQGLPLDEVTSKQLSEARPQVLQFLDATPTAVDEIIRQCQFSPSVVMTILLEAELAGSVDRYPGNLVARRYLPDH